MAGFGTRLAAALIDIAVTTIILTVIVVAAFLLGALLFESRLNGRAPIDVGAGITLLVVGYALAWFAALFVGQTLYYAGYHAGEFGMTPGKWAMRIEVVDTAQGGRPPRGRAIGRAAMYLYVSVQFFYIGCLWMLFDADKRTWHDMVTNTHVIESSAPRPGLATMLRAWTLKA